VEVQGLFERLVNELGGLLRQVTWSAAVDILLVALIFYSILRLFRGTQAISLLRGLLVVALVALLAASRLTAFNWLLRNSLPVILVAIPVIFQPELRRALERLGRTAPFLSRGGRETSAQRVVHEVILAVETLSRERTGALIVLEGETGLEEYLESGQRLDAQVSARLLTTIFFPGTPLHDGAVIVRNDRVVAAACVLPLTARTLPDGTLGTRHRAAVGMTEQCDALVVVVSEETGIISVARNGRIARRLDAQRLRRVLLAFSQPRRLLRNAA
jgi:diadenylate cyclase